MTNINEVPVVEVHNGNIRQIWPSLVLAVRSATFVAVDTELSGLGDRKQLFAKAIDDRYKAVCDVAKTRSIIAFGLSCFKLQSTANNSGNTDGNTDGTSSNGCAHSANLTQRYLVQTFNIFVMCTESYVVEPLAVQFLVGHGFDFNKQYSLGLPYTRGNDKLSSDTESYYSLRTLFSELLTSHVPVVLHNALVDLVFLYESLYASLPISLSSFLADLSQMFSAGLYDTKYIVEFKARWTSSFLEYAFSKSLRDNCSRAASNQLHFDIVYPQYDTHTELLQFIGLHTFGAHDNNKSTSTICQHYANHGWCSAGVDCCNSHDVDLILDCEDVKTSQRHKKHKRHSSRKHPTTTTTSESGDVTTNKCVGDVPVGSSTNSGTSGTNDTGTGTNCCLVECPEATAVVDKFNLVNVSNTDSSSVNSTVNSTPSTVNSTVNSGNTVPIQQVAGNTTSTGGHRAGFDAFMTGCMFAWSTVTYDINPRDVSLASDYLVNRVYLGGKDFPLQVTQSSFTKNSKSHVDKWTKLSESQ